MLKSILAAAAALVAGSSAYAVPIDLNFQSTVDRGEPFAIRACGDAFAPKTDVCYNEDRRVEVFPFSSLVGIDFQRNRVVRINCATEFARSNRTRRGQIANAYCPQAAAGLLPPASFL